MDWNRVEGNWKQLKGNIKEQWGKLTDDDLNVINGRRDQLEGKIATVTRRIRSAERWTTGIIASGGDEQRNAGICPRFCSRQRQDMARTDAPGQAVDRE